MFYLRVDVNKNEVAKDIQTQHSKIELNDSTTSSKSGSQVNLKYSYKEGKSHQTWSNIQF